MQVMAKTDYPFVGNAETGVVHRKNVKRSPCRVAEIKLENRENFKTLEQALAADRGERKFYQACKKCVDK